MIQHVPAGEKQEGSTLPSDRLIMLWVLLFGFFFFPDYFHNQVLPFFFFFSVVLPVTLLTRRGGGKKKRKKGKIGRTTGTSVLKEPVLPCLCCCFELSHNSPETLFVSSD